MAQWQAYYQVLKDQRFQLKKGEELTLDYKGVSNVTSTLAILAYKVATNGEPMKYEIDVNDQREVYGEVPVSHRFPVGTWETFSSSKMGRDGTVQFRVEDGDGWVEFSDVTLWMNRK